MTQQDSIETIDASIVDAARRILTGEVDPIEGSRQIARLSRRAKDPDDELYLVFRGVESETDDFPSGEERANWSPVHLAIKDRERADYLERVRQAVLDGCLALLQRTTPAS